jgi:hypothetical protein
MTKKQLERAPIAIAKTAGSHAAADVVALRAAPEVPAVLAAVANAKTPSAPASEDAALERVNVVLPRKLREDVEQKLLDLGRARRTRRVSFSGFVEAALREALANDPAALVDRWDARARRRAVNGAPKLQLAISDHA